MTSVVRVTLVSFEEQTMSASQKRQEYLMKEGRCPNCGIHTHEKKTEGVFSRTQLVPIQSDAVKNGRCMMCTLLPQEAVLVTKTIAGNPQEKAVCVAPPAPFLQTHGQRHDGVSEEDCDFDDEDSIVADVGKDAEREEMETKKHDEKDNMEAKNIVDSSPLETSPTVPPPLQGANIVAVAKDDFQRRNERLEAKRAKVVFGCGALVAGIAASIVTIFLMIQELLPQATPAPRNFEENVMESAAPTKPPAKNPAPAWSSVTLVPTPADQTAIPTAHRTAELRRVVATISGEVLLDNPVTPQFQALNWMLEDDTRQVEPRTEEWAILQRYALALFYFATGGEITWTQPESFLSVLHECHWHPNVGCYGGIGIPADQNVYRITSFQFEGGKENEYNDFGATGIVGQFPTEMALALPYLRELVIVAEQLTGTIPSSLGTLKYLRFLDLSVNLELSGTIPNSLGRATQLRSLAVTLTQVEGTLPTELGQLSKLTELWLGWNKIRGSIPSELGQLSKLELLYLQVNEVLTGTIPRELGNYSAVVDL